MPNVNFEAKRMMGFALMVWGLALKILNIYVPELQYPSLLVPFIEERLNIPDACMVLGLLVLLWGGARAIQRRANAIADQ